MATSSITKEFHVKDAKAYELLVDEMKKEQPRTAVTASPSLQKGREKLATFVFR